ncbi:hypothetical protein MIN45_P1481 [Methylomarinovum tepidoasis]|uniref:Thioredoxin-like fold domain-containing protein n=1 Tax=Methylomarinovum tepidoasis TaxID=2840183 RepID=A0AAU9CB10_9GAMM|nr:thioredoxin domain-containing protein [Methylomarinovum sp. IN45]BCX89111.1 hypothetical protein MIN45_P1481 [Methylomarinovum sp. IN45]
MRANPPLAIALLCSAPLLAAEPLQSLDQFKHEIITELLSDPRLRQVIREEIRAQEKRRALARIQNKMERQKAQIERLKKHLRPIDPKRDHIYGNPNAPVSVIEFSDFECPYCRKIHPTLKKLVHDSRGTINWVFRHMPADFHNPNAKMEAEAAECAAYLAGNESFWIFSEKLFLQPKRGKQDRQAAIRQAAKAAGISFDDLSSCVSEGRFRTKVEQDAEEAKRLGLIGTPANILVHHTSGRMILRQGAASLLRLRLDIAKLNAAQEKPGH